MTNQTKLILAAAGVLVVGAAFGWTASRLAHRPTTNPEPGTFASDTLAGDPRTFGYAVGGDQPAPLGAPVSPAPARTAPRRAPATERSHASGLSLAGEAVAVSVNRSLSSETAGVGEAWSGTVESPVIHNGRVVVPAGSTVHGTVVAARSARRGDRAMLQLGLTSVEVNGRTHRVSARSEPLVAGSTRTRNVGAIAAGTAAGALIGNAVGHGTRGTVIGALVGGAATSAGVAASRGYQATIAAGKTITFYGH